MKNKVTKTLIGATIASLMSTTAFSQVTVTGYVEMGMLKGSTKGIAATSQGLGGESAVTITGKGKLANGMEYMAYQTFDSDDTENQRGTAALTPMTTRAITIDPVKDVSLFYTFDGVYGGEIARTAIPVATERPADFTAQTTLREFIDVTSAGHAIGFDVRNLGPNARLSFAYNPNFDSLPQSSSDRIVSNNATGPASGYSVGYVASQGPVRVAAGITKIDQSQSTAAQDVDSKTLGITLSQAPFAVGAQRTRNEGLKIATVSTANIKDEIDSFSATYAASKELTFGVMYSEMERTGTGLTKGPDLKVTQVVAAYNLGPVVASLGYEKADNKVSVTNTSNTASTNEHTLTKFKIKANF
jgi:hypothetical protein